MSGGPVMMVAAGAGVDSGELVGGLGVLPGTGRVLAAIPGGTSGSGRRQGGEVLPFQDGGEHEPPGRSLGQLSEGCYRQVVDQVSAGIVAAATPQRTDRLFAGAGVAGENSAVTFTQGAAGVLWALAQTGVQVPAELGQWLAQATQWLWQPGPGLDGLGGIALTLDRLDRGRETARMWDALMDWPLDLLDHTVAGGLPGAGLALLERNPVPAGEGLMARVQVLAQELAARLAEPDLRFPGVGLWRGGSGAALFLLHVYELTEDRSLLGPIEDALARDLAVLDWQAMAGLGGRVRPARAGWVGTGPVAVAMVCHQAAEHLHAPWLTEARDAIMTRTLEHVLRWPGLGGGRAAALLAMQHMWAGPGASAQERLALVGPYLDLMTLHTGPERAGPTRMAIGGINGAAGTLLALDHLRGPQDRRLPFFW